MKKSCLQFLFATAAGALATLSFAPFSLWPLAILSPAILLFLLHNQSVKKAAWIGFFWGIGQFGTGINWVHVSIDTFGGMPKIASLFLMTLLVSYLALYPALFGYLLNKFFPNNKDGSANQNGQKRRLLLAAPILWLICDWLRGWVMTGFPWLWLGYSQIDSPLNGFAPVSGVEAITLAIMLIASSLVLLATNRNFTQAKKYLYLVVPVAIFGLSYLLNQVAWVTEDKDSTTRFALVQGNIPQHLKWQKDQQWPTLMKYTDLTREHWDADVVIWPEAAIPSIEYQVPAFLANIDEAARESDTALITGIINMPNLNEFYNSVISLGATEHGAYNYDSQPRYSKHHLLPFGEFVPFGDLLRPLAPFFNLPMSSFSRGGFVQQNVEANGRHFAAALCYEIIFSEQVRQNITDDTDYILTLSNDAWFGKSIGPLQHFEIARMRALELGKPMIRATNNGVTGVTDFKGKVLKTIPQFETGVLDIEVPTSKGNTPYRYLGSYLLYIWCLFGFVFCYLAQRKSK